MVVFFYFACNWISPSIDCFVTEESEKMDWITADARIYETWQKHCFNRKSAIIKQKMWIIFFFSVAGRKKSAHMHARKRCFLKSASRILNNSNMKSKWGVLRNVFYACHDIYRKIIETSIVKHTQSVTCNARWMMVKLNEIE